MTSHPRLVMEYRDTVVACLTDSDVTIREQAVLVIAGMATRKSLDDLVKRLMDSAVLAEGSYRDFLVRNVINMCSSDNYSRIVDFEWYVCLLAQLAGMQSTENASLIAQQLMDISIRVKSVRAFAVEACSTMVGDSKLMIQSSEPVNSCDILIAAAYIVGEFASLLGSAHEHQTAEGDDNGLGPAPVAQHEDVVAALLSAPVISLPPRVQRVYVQSAMKILIAAHGAIDSDRWSSLSSQTRRAVGPFSRSTDAEVQERACLLLTILELANGAESPCSVENLFQDLLALMDGELLPVTAKAQKKVKAEDDLDLGQWLYEPAPKMSARTLVVETQAAMNDAFYQDEQHEDDNDDDRSDGGYQPSHRASTASASAPSSRKSDGNVFYLGKSSPAVEPVQAKVVVVDEGREDRRRRRRRERDRAEVLIIAEEKDDAKEDEDSGSDNDIRRRLNVGDMSKVKEGQGELPQLKHRQTVVTPLPVKEDKSSRSKEKSSRSKDKDHEGHRSSKDKDRVAKSSSRSHRKEGEESSSRRHRSHKEHKEDKPAKSTKPESKKETSLLDFGEPEEAPQPVEEPKSKSSRHHHDKHSSSRHHSSRSKDKDSKEKSSSNLLDDLIDVDASSGAASPSVIDVFSDTCLRVTAMIDSTRARSAGVGADVIVSFTARNHSSKHITSLSVSVPEGGVGELDCGVVGVAPSTHITKNVTVAVDASSSDLLVACRVPVVVSYSPASGQPVRQTVFLTLPASTFIVATPIALPDFEALMRSSSLAHTQACRITLGRVKSLAEALSVVSDVVHLHVTASTPVAAMLYGQTVAEVSAGLRAEKICLMVKQVDESSLGVSVKASHAGLADAVSRQLQTILSA